MSSHVPNRPRVVPLRPHREDAGAQGAGRPAREPLWRHLIGGVLRRERLAQERTLKDVADTARISMPYLSELERGRKEASSEVLAAAAAALGLGLADLLARSQGELARHVRPSRPVGTGRHAHSGPAAPRQFARPAPASEVPDADTEREVSTGAAEPTTVASESTTETATVASVTSVTSVAELAARRGETRAAARYGPVLLAA